jgi:hypothetical protein
MPEIKDHKFGFEYKTITIFPDGIRVKGDDISDKIAALMNKVCNEYAKNNWKVISIVPSMKSDGAVTKLLVTFERLLS